MNSAPIPFHNKSSIGGQSDYEEKGIAGSFKAGRGLDIRKQKDTISCQQTLKDDLAPGTFDAACYFVVPSSDGNTYFFLYNGKIYRRNSSGTYSLVYTDTNESGHIVGATEWYDVSGWTYMIWATPTRLNIKKLIGPSYTPSEPWTDVNVASTGSWPKTDLTSTTWHTMAMANGVLQICNKNVMAIVGYDLSYSNNGVALIPGNVAKCVVERSKYGVIGCTRSDSKDETSLFNWDGIGAHWNDKEILKVGGLNSMIDTEIGLAQVGTNGLFYISDFTSPMPWRQIRGGGQSDPDGVASYKGMALFGIFGNTNSINGVYANGIYTVGRINKNAPIVLNLEYQLTCDEIYSVKVIGTDILCVYKNGSNYGVKIVDTANKATGVYQSLDFVAPMGTRRYPIPLGRQVNWVKIDIQTSPLPANCGVECWYKWDKNTTGGTNSDGWYQANTSGSVTQFTGTGKQNASFFVGQKGRTLEVMFVLTPSGNNAPEINEYDAYFTV